MARSLSAKRFLSLLSSSSSSPTSSKCRYSTSTSEQSSINSFLLFSPQQLITGSTCFTSDVLPGCDFKHWFILMHHPPSHLPRDDIISSYIKTLAILLGSQKKARMKIYSVSTRYYYAFGAEIPEKTAMKMKGLKNVGLVVPDFYMNVATKDYGGEPFINGQPVPYDPKYHEVYLRNRERAKRFLIQQIEKRQQPTFMGGGFPDMTGAPLESQTDDTKKKPKSSEPAKKKTRASVPAKKKTRASVPLKKKTRTSVFFVFMHDFRKTYDEEHLKSKSCAEVVKEASKKWKSLTDEEKEHYFNRAAQKAA